MCGPHMKCRETMATSDIACANAYRIQPPANARHARRASTERGQRMLAPIIAQAADSATAEQLTRDSAILGEQFYFFTVVLMWLIHAGFMSYEAGIARRKNVMATAMKNILTIAVVTPTFYYFGWWIYNCNQPGLPIGPN